MLLLLFSFHVFEFLKDGIMSFKHFTHPDKYAHDLDSTPDNIATRVR